MRGKAQPVGRPGWGAIITINSRVTPQL